MHKALKSLLCIAGLLLLAKPLAPLFFAVAQLTIGVALCAWIFGAKSAARHMLKLSIGTIVALAFSRVMHDKIAALLVKNAEPIAKVSSGLLIAGIVSIVAILLLFGTVAAAVIMFIGSRVVSAFRSDTAPRRRQPPPRLHGRHRADHPREEAPLQLPTPDPDEFPLFRIHDHDH